jgi:hypothetical protein
MKFPHVVREFHGVAEGQPRPMQHLQDKHGLPASASLEVAVVRSRASAGSGAVEALHEQVLRTLRRPA